MRDTSSKIYVIDQLNRVSREFEELKGKEARSVPLNAEVWSELTEFVESERIKGNELIFRNEAGLPIDHDNFLSRHFDKDVSEWGGQRINFHGLRHTAATSMLLAGVDLRTVGRILAHKNITTTARHLHVIDRQISEAASKFSIRPSQAKPDLRIVSGA